MDWLEELAESRRAKSPTYSEAETRIEAEDGGYEVYVVTDGTGKVLVSEELVAAGDAKGVYRL